MDNSKINSTHSNYVIDNLYRSKPNQKLPRDPNEIEYEK